MRDQENGRPARCPANRSPVFWARSSTWSGSAESLAAVALQSLGTIPGLTLRGIVDPARIDERVPTFAFTLAGFTPRRVAQELGKQGIAAWDGDYYAYELIRALGLGESGGMVRVGFVHYNEPREIERLARALLEISESAAPPSPNQS